MRWRLRRTNGDANDSGKGVSMMETIIVPVSEIQGSPIMNHKDFVKYIPSDQELKDAARGIDNVHGFLGGKAVVVDYSK